MTVNSSVSMLMDPIVATVKKDMPSTAMEERVVFPVVVTTQPAVAASIPLAGQPTTLWTSAASGTYTQKTLPPTISYPSPWTSPVMACTGVLLVPQTTYSFMMEARLLQHHWVSSVF